VITQSIGLILTVIISLLTAVLLYCSLLVGLAHYDAKSVSICISRIEGDEACTILKAFDLFKGAMAMLCMSSIILLLLLSSRYSVIAL